MGTYQVPTKEQVREYLNRRFGSNGPVPSMSEIRNELGWIEQSVAEDKLVCNNDVASGRVGSAT